MKKLLSLLLCLALVLSLAACGSQPDPTEPPTEAPTTAPTAPPTEPPTEPPMTVETLLAEMEIAMANNPITHYDTSFGFNMTMDMESNGLEISLDISMEMLLESVSAADGSASYSNTKAKMNMLGNEIENNTQVFTMVENGTVVSYTYTNTLDQWMFTDSGKTPEEYGDLRTNNDWLLELDPASVTLDDMVRELNGTTVYILRTESVTEFSESMTESLVGTIDPETLSGVPVPTTIWVDTETFLPIQVNVNVQAMMDALSESLAKSFVGETALDAKITMTTLDVNAHFSYDEAAFPELPQEAIDQTRKPEETDPNLFLPAAHKATDMLDGTFVLPCGDDAVIITCPAEWDGEVYDDFNIWIYNGDQSLYADIYYFTTWTEDDFMDQIQQDINDLKDLDLFISSGDGPVYEGYTTQQVMGDGESYCYAWTPIGDGYLLVILGDSTGEPNFESMLHQVLDPLVPYTGEFAAAGIFNLSCGDRNLTITCPDGWDGEMYDIDNVWIYNGDGSVYGDYYYMADWSEDDILEYWIQSDIDTLTAEATLASSGDGPAIDGYTTKSVIGQQVSYYYAWAPIGDGYFLLQIYDWDGGNDAAELLPQLLDIVSEN